MAEIKPSAVNRSTNSHILIYNRVGLRERCKEKKLKTKLTSVSFMYVCVAENGEMLVFFSFSFPNNSLIDNSLSELRF